MKEEFDISLLAKRAVDSLQVLGPVDSAMGITGGVTVKYMFKVAYIIFAIDVFIRIYELPAIAYILAGVFVCNLPKYIRRDHELPREYERALYQVRHAVKTGTMSKVHARLAYKNVIDKVIESLDDQPTTRNAKDKVED